MGSSAPDFVATTTSSASSKGIHISSLKCLLRRPETLRATPQIRNIHVVDIHSSSIHSAVTERILGLSDFCRLTPAACLTKLHLRLSDIFGADFLPIPHSPNVTVFTPSFRKFLRSTLSSLDTVVFAYQFPPLRAWTGLSPVRECPCWAYRESLSALDCSQNRACGSAHGSSWKLNPNLHTIPMLKILSRDN